MQLLYVYVGQLVKLARVEIKVMIRPRSVATTHHLTKKCTGIQNRLCISIMQTALKPPKMDTMAHVPGTHEYMNLYML